MQSCLGAADVPALSGAVAVSEQPEQSFDAWSAATKMLGRSAIGQHPPTGLEQLLVVLQADVASGFGGAAARLKRTVAAHRGREVRATKPGLGRVDRNGIPAGAGDRVGVEINAERTLAQAAFVDRPLGHLGQDVHLPIGEFCPDGAVAIGGVAEDPPRSSLGRLGVDQVLGLRSVLLSGSSDVHGRDQRL